VKQLARAAVLLACAGLACAVLAQAQMGSPPGVPASALSITPHNPTPGVPASVTSYSAFHPPAPMGFNVWNPPTIVGMNSLRIPRQRGDFDRDGDRDRHGRGHFRQRGYGYGYAYAVPYSYAYPSYAEPEPEAEPQPAADQPSGNAMERELWSRAAEREDRSLDRNDARHDARTQADESRYGEHYLDGREQGGAPERAAAPVLPEVPETALVLVLKDGTRMELGNYAIMGQTIYDLGHRGKKVSLAQVDLAATAKANDERGLEFKLPAR
jgi:hypothetical protein